VIYLVFLILVIEVARLFWTITDSARINTINKRALEHSEKALAFEREKEQDWQRLRELELAEIRRLAKDSDTLREVLESLEIKKA